MVHATSTQTAPDHWAAALSRGIPMGKGNNARGNKEVRKQKQVKPKEAATSDKKGGAVPAMISGKKAK